MIAPLILFAMFAGGIYFVILPFLKTVPSTTLTTMDENLEALELTKVNLLTQIREVEFEHAMGIVSTEDFDRIRGELVSETGSVISQLESLGDFPGKATDDAAVLSTTEIECPTCGQPVKPDSRFCSSCGASLLNSCPACGHSVDASYKFCTACGSKLSGTTKSNQ